MTDGDQMSTDSDDLGPMPEPEIEPGEPNPGGPDAIDVDEPDPPASRDLSPDDNPAVEDAAPDVLKEGEDTSTRATEDADESTSPEEESPA
ncbi:hypothetical protein [Nocardioides sp.]|uniref:hypothetical protein n=1 Tax=Nocardioides sp. TaxID=35761 RepID=UPI0031FE44E3